MPTHRSTIRSCGFHTIRLEWVIAALRRSSACFMSVAASCCSTAAASASAPPPPSSRDSSVTMMLPGQMSVRGLVEHLPDRAHPAQQFTDHGVGVGRFLESAAGVREPAKRFIGFMGITGRVDGRRDRWASLLASTSTRYVMLRRCQRATVGLEPCPMMPRCCA